MTATDPGPHWRRCWPQSTRPPPPPAKAAPAVTRKETRPVTDFRPQPPAAVPFDRLRTGSRYAAGAATRDEGRQFEAGSLCPLILSSNRASSLS